MLPRLLFLSLFAATVTTIAPARAQEVPPELLQAKAQHQKEVEFALRPMRERYIARLETLKRTLTGRGDLRAAVAVQDEIDLLVATVNEAAIMAKFVGTWVAPVGANRRYTVKPDGTVQWMHDTGAVSATGRLVRNGKDFTFVWDTVEEVDRVTLTESGMAMDCFQPKTAYPAGPAMARVTLIKSAINPK